MRCVHKDSDERYCIFCNEKRTELLPCLNDEHYHSSFFGTCVEHSGLKTLNDFNN